jgi:hypothetical protein
MKFNWLVFSVVAILMIGMANAIVEDSQVKIRDSSNFDLIQEDILFLNQNPDPAAPGDYVEIRVKVENIGIEAAEEMYFEVVPEYPFSLDPGASREVKLGDTDARQIGENAYVLYWKLRIDKSAVQGNNKLKMRYSSDKGMKWVELDDFYVRVQTDDAIINIVEAVTDPKEVAPGEEFNLKITLENLADSYMEDVTTTVTLLHLSGATVVQLPFTPVGMSNVKTIKQLDGGANKIMTFRMVADVDATTGAYKVPIEVSYSDNLNKNFTKTSFIGLKVGSTPDLFVSLDRPSASSAGKEMDMTVRFINKGVEDIRFAFATIEEPSGLTVLSPKETYIGNIDSDDFETEDFVIKADRCDKEYTIPITVEYMSMSNERFEDRYETTFTACTGETQNGGSKTGIVGFLIVVVIVVVAIIIYRRMKKKKAKKD